MARGRADLAELAEARAVVPNAAGAKLLAVCPAGVEPGGRTDAVLDAAHLLAAWGSR